MFFPSDLQFSFFKMQLVSFDYHLAHSKSTSCINFVQYIGENAVGCLVSSTEADDGVQYRSVIPSVQCRMCNMDQSHHQYGLKCAVQDYQNCLGGCQWFYLTERMISYRQSNCNLDLFYCYRIQILIRSLQYANLITIWFLDYSIVQSSSNWKLGNFLGHPVFFSFGGGGGGSGIPVPCISYLARFILLDKAFLKIIWHFN